MTKKAREIPIEIISECLEYTPSEGTFFWKTRPQKHFNNRRSMAIFNARFAGKQAGSLAKNGYIMVRALNTPWLAHRLAWSIYHSVALSVDLCIDHINGIKSDNRIVNLRAVTAEINNRNSRLDKRNSSGQSGVYFCKIKNKWASQIHLHGKHCHLGYFLDLKDAILARKKAETENGYHKNHGSSVTAR